MTQYIEEFLPPIQSAGLNTLENVSVGGTLDVTGAVTFTVAPTGPQTATTVVQSALVGATVALTAAQSGGVFINRSTSGSPSWTLPTNVAGLTYTFLTANTTAGFTVTGGTIFAKASATSIAAKTLEGFELPDEQAAPILTAIPFKSKSIN